MARGSCRLLKSRCTDGQFAHRTSRAIGTQPLNKVTLILDGNTAGREAADAIAARLVHKLHVRVVGFGGWSTTRSAFQDHLDELLK